MVTVRVLESMEKESKYDTYYVYDTDIGRIAIASDGSAITKIKLDDWRKDFGLEQRCDIKDEAARQLVEYLAGTRQDFDVPLSPRGTEFQRAAWKALVSIPYGQTRTYKEIAEVIGSPKACRAVGLANNRNPIWIMIPCHRVIGANGKLVGYAAGLEVKERLLGIERGGG